MSDAENGRSGGTGAPGILATPPEALTEPASDAEALPEPGSAAAVIRPSIRLARGAYLANDAVERAHAEADPEVFWAERAEEIDWIEPWREVLRFDPPRHEWFVGGRLNAATNCLDRHVYGERRNKAALLWVGEDGEEQAYTYNRLYREVNRFANALRRLGVRKGDRVVLYMPVVPEAIITMLACARLGAIHAVVRIGLDAGALRARVVDSGARVVVCSDFTFQRGRKVPLAPTVDEAVQGLVAVEHVVVHRRGSRPGDALARFDSVRVLDFYDIQNAREIHCPPESMDAEDPLFLLYAPGNDGRPRGVVHSTGGYLVGVAYLARAFLQIGERDIYWCAADLDRIEGHSFLVYGPLAIGATVFCREGAHDHPSPDVTWELVERFGINLLFTSPAALRTWKEHGAEVPGRFDLSRLRLLAAAGEPLDPETHWWAQENLVAQAEGLVVDNFWTAEIAAPLLGGLPTFEVRPGKVGKSLPGSAAEVVDADGRSAPAGQAGRLVLRRPLPHLMRSIWNDPEAYAAYWSRVPGCFDVGTAAVRDADGYFAILSRGARPLVV